MSASGPYWVLISQKNGSLLGPDLKAWGSLLVLETVGGSRGSRGRPTGFHGVKVRDELIVSRNNRMPIYRTFQHIEKNIEISPKIQKIR